LKAWEALASKNAHENEVLTHGAELVDCVIHGHVVELKKGINFLQIVLEWLEPLSLGESSEQGKYFDRIISSETERKFSINKNEREMTAEISYN
jgi:hypothetical protein